jgi:hypothetical protein
MSILSSPNGKAMITTEGWLYILSMDFYKCELAVLWVYDSAN